MSLAQVAAAARSSAALPLTLAVAAIDVDPGAGEPGESVGVHDTVVLPVASASKLLLLAEVARRLDGGALAAAAPDGGTPAAGALVAGALAADRPVEILAEDVTGGTGLLGRLGRPGWTVEDLAWLTAAVSDNTATNALLRLVGLPATARLARDLGLERLTLHDRVRDERGPGVPPVFATGTARDLARLVALAARGTMASPAASARLLGWMRANTDHGLVPALIDHDPYAPGFPEPLPGRLLVASKTGTDTGVRADAGLLVGARRVAYAVVAHWDTALGPSTERAAVHAIRDVGRALAAWAQRPAGA
ncbi:serine hydrolase [Kitasatospora sp. NPDC056446]|uniref:serine hydrolase n=1 Tax=Kitasatospora sp. NPDC056446 TaxID=3345819 RepID=UPI0036B7D419